MKLTRPGNNREAQKKMVESTLSKAKKVIRQVRKQEILEAKAREAEEKEAGGVTENVKSKKRGCGKH